MKQELFDMSDDVFQIGYDAGYQAAREGEILFQLRHLEHPVQHQIITCYSQMGPLWVSLVVAKIGKLTNGEFENNWGQIIGKKDEFHGRLPTSSYKLKHFFTLTI